MSAREPRASKGLDPMRVQLDPDRAEIEALKRATDWHRKHVLDIGCGDGRLTRRLAGLGATVRGIDLDEESIREARRNLPRRLACRVRFRVADARDLPFGDATFDAVVYSWSF
jgi:2-polyprenyl-3-methyl-5-hydroxy-6-metoxy-1,4-benzoquinol methylase